MDISKINEWLIGLISAKHAAEIIEEKTKGIYVTLTKDEIIEYEEVLSLLKSDKGDFLMLQLYKSLKE